MHLKVRCEGLGDNSYYSIDDNVLMISGSDDLFGESGGGTDDLFSAPKKPVSLRYKVQRTEHGVVLFTIELFICVHVALTIPYHVQILFVLYVCVLCVHHIDLLTLHYCPAWGGQEAKPVFRRWESSSSFQSTGRLTHCSF